MFCAWILGERMKNWEKNFKCYFVDNCSRFKYWMIMCTVVRIVLIKKTLPSICNSITL